MLDAILVKHCVKIWWPQPQPPEPTVNADPEPKRQKFGLYGGAYRQFLSENARGHAQGCAHPPGPE